MRSRVAAADPLSLLQDRAGPLRRERSTATAPTRPARAASYETLVHFVSKAGLDIVGLGPERVRQLLEAGVIHDAAGLYGLTAEQLLPLEGFAEQSATALIEAIDASRSRPLRMLLTALGIRHVGATAAKLLARRYGSLTALRQATDEELEALEGIGPVISASVLAFLADETNAALLDRLTERGVALKETGVSADGPRPLAGRIFVLTGSLPTLKRAEAAELIEAAGGTVKSSVSKKTDTVVAGDEAGDKLAKAEALGIEVIDEAELLRRTGRGA